MGREPSPSLPTARAWASERACWSGCKAASASRVARITDLRARPEPPGPDVMLRPLHVEQDAVRLHALDDTSFADAADYHRQSLEAFREEHLGAHDLDPQLSRVAERNGEIVGFLLARRRTTPPVGFVDILAVDPGHQRRSIGTALLT